MNGSSEAVRAHLETVVSEIRRRDVETLLKLMARAAGEEPRMWGQASTPEGGWEDCSWAWSPLTT